MTLAWFILGRIHLLTSDATFDKYYSNLLPTAEMYPLETFGLNIIIY